MGVFGFFLFKKMAWDLIDVVYDAGDHLVFQKKDIERQVKFEDVVNVNYSAGSPPRVTVTSRTEGPLGKDLTFIPAMHGRSLMRSKPPIVDELIERAGHARRSNKAVL